MANYSVERRRACYWAVSPPTHEHGKLKEAGGRDDGARPPSRQNEQTHRKIADSISVVFPLDLSFPQSFRENVAKLLIGVDSRFLILFVIIRYLFFAIWLRAH